MNLPNAHLAVVELTKLQGYCLNPEHPHGKHKARVFLSSLGMVQADAAILRRYILTAISSAGCVAGTADDYGQRFFADFQIRHRRHAATIRTAWIIRTREDFPRLTTCYLL